MDRRIGATLSSLIAAILFFLSIGLTQWSCEDSVLGVQCIELLVGKVTGSLLLVAGFLLVLTVIFLISTMIWDEIWIKSVSITLCCLATITSLAAMTYYLMDKPLISPYIAVAAMSISFTLTVILIFDLFAIITQ